MDDVTLGAELTDMNRGLLGLTNLIIGAMTFLGLSSLFVTALDGHYSPWWTWILGSYWFASISNVVAFRDADLNRVISAIGNVQRGARSLIALGSYFAALAESFGVAFAICRYWYPLTQPIFLWAITAALFGVYIGTVRSLRRDL